MAPPLVGVLALQGAFHAHELMLAARGATTREVRVPADLDGIDALVLPGGESTTMSRLLETSGLWEPVADRLARGLPVLGTCAGMILLAAEVADGRADQRCFGALDIAIRRNAFGRQLDSFECDLDVAGLDAIERDAAPQPGPGVDGSGASTFHAVFIRAPRIERCGPDVRVLAAYGDEPVLVAQGSAMVASFHPELTSDSRIHGLFLRGVGGVPPDPVS